MHLSLLKYCWLWSSSYLLKKPNTTCSETAGQKRATFFWQNCFKTSPKAMFRLLPAWLNQGVAGYKMFLQKGVMELLSTTCNSLICLRFVVEQTRKVALNSFAAILYKILRVFYWFYNKLSGYKKLSEKRFWTESCFHQAFRQLWWKHTRLHILTLTITHVQEENIPR